MQVFQLFLFVLMAIGVALGVFSARSKRRQREALRLIRQDGLEVDFTFKGRTYVSLDQASDGGGDHGGNPFELAISKQRQIIRFVFGLNEKPRAFYVPFGDIEFAKRMSIEAGEYGDFPLLLIALAIESDAFPLDEIFIYPADLDLLDALSDALGPKKITL